MPCSASGLTKRHLFEEAAREASYATVVESLSRCSRCDAPTIGDVCAFCRLVEVASAHELVPIEVLRPAKARRARG